MKKDDNKLSGRDDRLEIQRVMAETNAIFNRPYKKRYLWILSWQTFFLLMGVGILFLIMGIVHAVDVLRYGNVRAAAVGVILAGAYILLIVIWEIISVWLRKQEASERYDPFAYMGKIPLTNTYDYVDTAKAKPKYSVESFEALKPRVYALAKKEWEDNEFTITDTYYRMTSIEFPDKNQKMYDVFIEIRYEKAKPSRSAIDELENRVGHEFVPLQKYDFSVERDEAKREIREIIEQNFRQLFPDIRVTEIGVSIIKSNI